MRIQTIIFALILMFGIVSTITDKLFCYYGSWAVYRPGNGKFDVEDTDPYLCTHYVYTFVGINSDGSIRILDSYNDVDKGAFKRFNNIKKHNPKAKVLIAIGGWNEGSTTFSQVAANPHLRSSFKQSTITFLSTYGFDGLDLDWEYPARRGGSPSDKTNFIEWLSELRVAFDNYGYLLTSAVSATKSNIEISYDVPALSRYLDFINVMTYDLHGDWDRETGHNAPLYPSSLDVTPALKELNVESSIRAWISEGAEPQKLILGIGLYGRTFRLSSNNHGLGAPASGPGEAGPYTRQAGVLGYNEILEKLDKEQWTIVWDDEIRAPYAYKGNQWVGYDNIESIILKVQCAKDLNLGGAMVWSIETDDFRGTYGLKNPLLSTIRSNLDGEAPIRPPPDPSTTTPIPPITTTSKPGSSFKCSKQGYFKDPEDCSKFYFCLLLENGDFLKYDYECPAGLVFDEDKLVCDHKYNYPCWSCITE